MYLSRLCKPYAIIFGLFLAHLSVLALPSVNLEFTFVDASIYFRTKEIPLLEQYFRFQANTLGLPYLGHLAAYILPGLDMLIVLRLLSSFGIILLGLAIINFSEFLKYKSNSNLLLLILLNPLVWVFSGRATADFLPAALGIYALSLLASESKTLIKVIFASTILGFSAILKYHSILLLFILTAFLYDFKKKKFEWNTFLLASSISILMMLIYIGFVKIHFDFWLTPPAFQSRHQVNVSGLISNFFLYIGYLVMLCAPISLIINYSKIFTSKKNASFILFGLGIFTVGFYGFHNHGELNVGPLDAVINKNVLNGLLAFLSIYFFSLIYFTPRNESQLFTRVACLSIGLVIFALSITRPAQRYLIFVIPFYVLLLPENLISNKYLARSSVAIYCLINIFIGYNQWCTGTSAEVIATKIKNGNLLPFTSPGVVEPHVGNLFSHYEIKDAKYTVTSGLDPNAKIFAQSGISFMKKSYSLTEIPQASGK